MLYTNYYVKSYVLSAKAVKKHHLACQYRIALKVHNASKLLGITALFVGLFDIKLKQRRASVRRRRHKTVSLICGFNDLARFVNIAMAYGTSEINQYSKFKPDVGLNKLGNIGHYSELKWMYQSIEKLSDVVGQTVSLVIPDRGTYGFVNKFLNI